MSRRFDHEKLEVYQTSLEYMAWLEPILQKLGLGLAGPFEKSEMRPKLGFDLFGTCAIEIKGLTSWESVTK